MSLEVKGINNLIKKLDNLTNINTESIVKDVAKEVEKSLRNEAKTFSNKAYKYIGECDTRKYGRSVFVDVGLKNDKVEWDLWKELWFHQWGYHNYGLNFHGQYIDVHKLWFDIAIKNINKTTTKQLKDRLQNEISKNIRK